jgi:hypothetical protein
MREVGGFRIGFIHFKYQVVGASEEGYDVQVWTRALNRRYGTLTTLTSYFHNVPDLKTLKKLVAQRFGLV